MKNTIKPGLIVLIPVFFGCDTVDDFGTEFNLETDVSVNVVDFNLPATNLFIDSLRTDSEDRILVGNYSDPLTGAFEAEGYFRFTYNGGGTLPTRTEATEIDSTAFEESNPPDTLFFDSLVLQIEVLNTLGNIGTPLDFEVFELFDTLEQVAYLATRSESLNTPPIAIFSGFPEDIFDEDGQVLKNADSVIRQSINIGISQSYGQSFFDQVSEIIRDEDQFFISASFKDLAIAPTSSSARLAELSTSSTYSQLTLFMDDPDDDSVYTIEFPLTGIEYSNLSRERSTSSFNGIEEKQDFDLSDGTTVLDPLGGITTAFSISEIESFFDENPQILINSATISFDISDNLPRDTVESFRLYFRKSNGGFFGPATEIPALAFENLVLSDEGYINTRSIPALATFEPGEATYTLNSTLFFQSLYNNYQVPEIASLVFLNPFNSDTIDVSELVMASPDNITLQQTIFNNSGINLRVFYTEVN